jgi:hypothetical protein
MGPPPAPTRRGSGLTVTLRRQSLSTIQDFNLLVVASVTQDLILLRAWPGQRRYSV